MHRLSLGVISAAGLAVIVGSAEANSVVNGDFEAGNTLFTSAYTYVNPLDPFATGASIYSPATYSVVQFDTLHPSWVDFDDHTFNGASRGHFMIVNGTNDGSGPTWAQSQTLDVGRYELSAWFASLFPAAPASLEFRVKIVATDGVVVSDTFYAPLPPGGWARESFEFNIADAGSYIVQIWDTNNAFSGNDYAIDDISLIVIPLPTAAWAGLSSLAGVAGFGFIRRRRFMTH